MKRLITILSAASVVLLTGCCTTHRVTQWEHRTEQAVVAVEPRSDPLAEHLNQLAAQGWVVQSVLTPEGYGKFATFLLKRPKQ